MAFSLIEMLVVLIIVATLGGLALNGFVGYRAKAREASTVKEAQMFFRASQTMWTWDRKYENLLDANQMETKYRFVSSRVQNRFVTMELPALVGCTPCTGFAVRFYHPLGEKSSKVTEAGVQEPVNGIGGDTNHLHPTDPANLVCAKLPCYHAVFH